MAGFSQAELRRIERQFPTGIGSSSLVDIFQTKGERFSEATLRKYVQLGLLPKSRRVGERGRHRGSTGLYPVSIVRMIDEIKTALDAGATLEEVRFGRVGLLGEVEQLERASGEVWQRFLEAAERTADKQRQSRLRAAVQKQRVALNRQYQQLHRLAADVAQASRRVS